VLLHLTAPDARPGSIHSRPCGAGDQLAGGRPHHRGARHHRNRVLSQNPGFSKRPTLTIDKQGTTYVAWDDSSLGNREILFAQEPAGGTWSPPINASNTPRASWEPTLAAATDGTLHLAWLDYTPGNFTVFYANRLPGGTWSSAVAVSAPGLVFSPALATDAAGGVHLV
jgi:hypothetical protein